MYKYKYKMDKVDTVKIVSCAVIGTALFGAGIYLASERGPEYNPTPITIEESNTIVKTKPITIDEVKTISQLNVMNMQVSKETVYVEPHKFLWMESDKNLFAKYYFNLKYSIDLSSLTDDQIVIEGGTIKIYTKDLDVDISVNESMSEYKQEKKGRFIDMEDMKLTPEEYNEAIEKLKKETLVEAHQGLDYENAITRAEESIGTAIKQLTKQEYVIDVIIVK